MFSTLVYPNTQNTSHTQPQLTSQPHTTLKTDVVILSSNSIFLSMNDDILFVF